MTSAHPLDRLRVGMRAVVRHRLDDGLSDALGEVVALDDEPRSASPPAAGVQVVPRAAVVAAKEVPPAPSRRGAPHLALSMEDLQRVMVERLAAHRAGGRSAAGCSAPQADSPVGPTRCCLWATPACRCPRRRWPPSAWYAERGLPPDVHPLRARGLRGRRRRARRRCWPRRGYTDVNRSVVMTAASRPGPAVAALADRPAPRSARRQVTVRAEATRPRRSGGRPATSGAARSPGPARGDHGRLARPGVPARLARGRPGRRPPPGVAFAHAWAGVVRPARRARLAAPRAGHRPHGRAPRAQAQAPRHRVDVPAGGATTRAPLALYRRLGFAHAPRVRLPGRAGGQPADRRSGAA